MVLKWPQAVDLSFYIIPLYIDWAVNSSYFSAGPYLSCRRLMNGCMIICWSPRESLQKRFGRRVGPEEPTSGSGGREKDLYNAVKVVPGV